MTLRRQSSSCLFETIRSLQPSPYDAKMQKAKIQDLLNKTKNSADSEVDTSAPDSMGLPHLQHKAKARLTDRERVQQLEAENRYLLDRMRRLMVRPGVNQAQAPFVPKNPSFRMRTRGLVDVARENIRLLKILLGDQTFEFTKRCDEEYQRRRKDLKLQQKFETPWKEHQLKRTAHKLVSRSVSKLIHQWGGMPEPPSSFHGNARFGKPASNFAGRSPKELALQKVMSSPYVAE